MYEEWVTKVGKSVTFYYFLVTLKTAEDIIYLCLLKR